jgi:hypothetical protein
MKSLRIFVKDVIQGNTVINWDHVVQFYLIFSFSTCRDLTRKDLRARVRKYTGTDRNAHVPPSPVVLPYSFVNSTMISKIVTPQQSCTNLRLSR